MGMEGARSGVVARQEREAAADLGCFAYSNRGDGKVVNKEMRRK